MRALKQLAKTIVFIVLGTAAAYLLLKYVAPLFAPFIAALFLAFLIEPLVDLLQRKGRMPRGVAVGIAMLAVFGGLAVAVSMAVARLIIELVHLSAFLPQYINNMKSFIITTQGRIEAFYFRLPRDVLDFIEGKLAGSSYSLDSLLSRAQVVTSKLLNILLQTVSSVPSWIILIIISAIATYFMSKDRRAIINFWLRTVPEPWGRKTLEISRDIVQAIIGYARAQLILISITFVQSLAGLYIIGAPYALIMGLAIGVADLIPVLGPSSIYLPWIIWEFATGDTAFAVKLLVLFGIVLTVRQVLETKIVSFSIGLHPLATLMAIYVGLKLMGPLGVVAGPLFVITLKAFATAGVIRLDAGKKE